MANAGDCFAADSPTAHPARACPAPTAGTTTRAGAAPGTGSSARARPAARAQDGRDPWEVPAMLTLVRARNSHPPRDHRHRSPDGPKTMPAPFGSRAGPAS
jgi:hypothetical protein